MRVKRMAISGTEQIVCLIDGDSVVHAERWLFWRDQWVQIGDAWDAG